MQELLIYFVCFIILALSVAGLGKLVMVTIQPGEIFGSWQKVLRRIHSKFLYMSLGGCATCTRQRIAEITYVFYVVLWNDYNGHYIFYPCQLWLKVVLNIGVYLLWCGLVIYFGSLIEYEKKKVEAIENDEIIKEVL